MADDERGDTFRSRKNAVTVTTQYTVFIRSDDDGGRIVEVKGIVSQVEFDKIREKLGNFYTLPVDEKIKVEIE